MKTCAACLVILAAIELGCGESSPRAAENAEDLRSRGVTQSTIKPGSAGAGMGLAVACPDSAARTCVAVPNIIVMVNVMVRATNERFRIILFSCWLANSIADTDG